MAFVSFGCKVNQAEIDTYISALSSYNAECVADIHAADLVVVNTCAVTAKAQADGEKYLRTLKAANPDVVIAATGCLAELMKERLSGVDIIVANADKAALLSRVFPEAVAVKADSPRRKTRAFLKVQDGCDAFCTYCIIPSLRGAPVSVPVADVLAEAKRMISVGYKEIVVTGVHVGRYGMDNGSTPVELLRALAGIQGEFRLRMTSLDVPEINSELIDTVRVSNGKICPHFHISLQSGSSYILSRMGRKYSAVNFLSAVSLIRSNIPYASIGIDLITGFPGESDGHFDETLSVLKAAELDYIHVFPYSERPGTPAAGFADSVPVAVRKNRAKIVREMGQTGKAAGAAAMIGREVAVLAEKGGKGHTENYYLMKLPPGTPVNKFYRMRVVSADAAGVLSGVVL